MQRPDRWACLGTRLCESYTFTLFQKWKINQCAGKTQCPRWWQTGIFYFISGLGFSHVYQAIRDKHILLSARKKTLRIYSKPHTTAKMSHPSHVQRWQIMPVLTLSISSNFRSWIQYSFRQFQNAWPTPVGFMEFIRLFIYNICWVWYSAGAQAIGQLVPSRPGSLCRGGDSP